MKRFFHDSNNVDSLFLIDEAHNLLERGREMYSATLKKEDFLALKKLIKPFNTTLENKIDKCNKELLLLKRECENYQILTSVSNLAMCCGRLYSAMDTYLEKHPDIPIKEEILDFYFKLNHFLLIFELLDDNYEIYSEHNQQNEFIVKLFCVDPSKNLQDCMQRGRSSILFSATLLPIQYYKALLGGTKEDYEVYANSTFDSNNRGLFIASDVTSKYTRRTQNEFETIVQYIYDIIQAKQGNYLIFFPSHSFLQQIYQLFMEGFNTDLEYHCVVQQDFMKEEEREEILEAFESSRQDVIGFCVLGGIFSEGIDLKEERLIGSIIIGTGLPQVCNEREILKQYFDRDENNGFDYSYRYPGMNKVLQAAGRVIRTNQDRGIIALLDERFLQNSTQKLFPREWNKFQVVNKYHVKNLVSEFWKKQDDR